MEALARRPMGFLRSAWPWRSVAYLVSGVAARRVTVAVFIAARSSAGAVLAIVLVGLLAFPALLLAGVDVARLERWRLRLVDRDPLPDPHRPPGRAGGGLRPGSGAAAGTGDVA